MGNREDRPRAGVSAPPLDGTLQVLRELLTVERARLETATRIEKERSIVFPETTIIIRDIQKLLAAIERKENPERSSGVFGLEIDF